MNVRGQIVIAAAAVLLSAGAMAQSNVGDVMKAGGKRMTKDELVQLHAGGVTMRGTLNNGTPYSQQNKPDGSVVGSAGNNGQFTLSGTWRIDDEGLYCHKVEARNGPSFNVCSVIWKQADKYYASAKDSADEPVRERQFSK